MRRAHSLRIVVRLRRARGHLGRFLTGSFAVHGLLFALVVIVPASRHRAVPIEDTMVVALAGPIAAAPAPTSASAPSPAKPAPAPPAPPPPPKEAHTVREVPIAKPKEKPAKALKSPEPTPAPAPATPPTAAKPSSGPAGGGNPSAPPAGTGAVTAMVGTGDSSLAWYGAAVKAALEAAWTKPPLEEGSGTASVVVTFDIARDGATSNIKISHSSGIPSMDRSAERAVIEASPLPGIPPTWTGSSIPVTMRFDLTPEAR